MAQLNSDGSLMLEPEDVLPRKIAIKTDDPAEIVEKIKKLNEKTYTAEEFVKVVAEVDKLRKAYFNKENADLEKNIATQKELLPE